MCFAQTTDPVLYFSDITSGPKSGNSDASGARTPGQDGAIVTVWGVNLGASQGNSRVVCNGADAASYYMWSNATQPADLYSYHRMQMISFQVNHLAQDGLGELYVMVNGLQSNSLPFTIRNGNIFFIKTTGDDNSGNGSWSQPWSTIQKAASSLGLGDIAYILDGINESTIRENDACVNLDSDGSATHPKSLIAYPGAIVVIGTDSAPRAFWNYDGNNNIVTNHWVISKFRIRTIEVGVYTRDGFRVIGNWFTAPNGDGMDGTINIEGINVFILGNELENCGSINCDKLYHVIYGKGIRQDSGPRAPMESRRDVGWNYLHDNLANRGINIYSEQDSSAFIAQHRIHDNVIINQRGDGIMLGYYVIGDNWIYNNLLVNAGIGPEWADPSYHCGIHLNTGHEYITATTVYCYNNTLFGCGFSGAAFSEETGHILISPEAIQRSSVIHFSNNIIYSTGEPYMATESTVLPSGNHLNCWFGAGTAPGWDTGALNVDPQFVNSGTNNFQLQNTSQCVNTGLNVSTVVERDLLGVLRTTNPFDVGVYEYISTTGVNEDLYKSSLSSFKLEQNYPNPFNPKTNIQFTIPNNGFVSLKVFDLLGREITTIVNENLAHGIYERQWDASKFASGIYFYRLVANAIPLGQTGSFIETKKLLLLK
jgi:hypothetical protein